MNRSRKTLSLALLLPLSLASLGAFGQELSTFMSKLPPPGAWARYRVETRKPGWMKREPFDLAVTDGEAVNGQPHVWLEAGPTNFVGYKDGYLRILVKASPSKSEALNPFLAAVAVAYQEPKGEPFKLSDDAVGFMHGQAKDIKVVQEVKDLPPEPAETVKGESVECTKSEITTTTDISFFTQKTKIVEKGTYWFSKDTPFRVVKAEIERVEYKKGKEDRRREITVTLKEASMTGAATHFTKPATKKKGLWGLLFH